MSEILGDVDDGVEYLRSVGGVQGRLGGWQLQPTLEFELVAVVPHTHCVRTESSEILLLYSYIVIPIHLLMYILIQTNTTYVYTLLLGLVPTFSFNWRLQTGELVRITQSLLQLKML